jgi:glycine cleavage system H protein
MRPKDRRYTASHEWAKPEGALVTVGITDFAVESLGDLTFLKLPSPPQTVAAKDVLGEIESVKAVAELYAPVGGTIVEVNEAVPDALDLLAKDPFGAGWLVRIRPSAPGEILGLLSAEEYEKGLEPR